MLFQMIAPMLMTKGSSPKHESIPTTKQHLLPTPTAINTNGTDRVDKAFYVNLGNCNQYHLLPSQPSIYTIADMTKGESAKTGSNN